MSSAQKVVGSIGSVVDGGGQSRSRKRSPQCGPPHGALSYQKRASRPSAAATRPVASSESIPGPPAEKKNANRFVRDEAMHEAT
jgi:hypothetical protein